MDSSFVMLVSPLVLFFHPLDPLRVGRVEGRQTDWCGLVIAESLVGTQDRPHSGHQLRKNDVLPAAPLFGATLLLPSLLPSFLVSVISRHGISFQDDGLRKNRPYFFFLILL